MISIAKHTELKKKLIVNLLPFPIEIVRQIKDYIYHDEKTSPTIQKMRESKNEIINLIKYYTSVKMNEEIEAGGIIDEEDWWLRISIPMTPIYSQVRNMIVNHSYLTYVDDYWPLPIEYEFSARNCKVCGEYKKYKKKNGIWCYYEVRGLTSQNTCKC